MIRIAVLAIIIILYELLMRTIRWYKQSSDEPEIIPYERSYYDALDAYALSREYFALFTELERC